MNISFDNRIKNKTVAIAVSGGSDSMVLLNYMLSVAKNIPAKIIALNVEHGIRGKESIKDSLFVEEFCKQNNVPLLKYSGDAISKAQQEKISIELSARLLRYAFFKQALDDGKCDFIATAHHSLDNVETVLLNVFRGSGLKGVTGIKDGLDGKILRPFLHVSKQEINDYIKEHGVPFVTDQTNFSTDYTRNKIRLEIIPKIKEIFPELEKSVNRFASIAKEEDEFLDSLAKEKISFIDGTVQIKIPLNKVLLSRAVIIALKNLGVEKDWEKAHIDSVINLSELKNSSKANLLNGIVAVKEYDKITLYKNQPVSINEIPFTVGMVSFNGTVYGINVQNESVNLKDGLYADLDKIPKTSVIRTMKNGDVFTKFGGGTKKLCDYFTDKKIPERLRKLIPLVCDKNEIYVILGVAVSDKIKVDNNTKTIIKFTKED